MTKTTTTRIALAAAALWALGAGPARADFIAGGTGKSECYAGIDLAGSPAATVSKTKITCTDGDACDTGTCGDGACTFTMQVCWNNPDVPGCTAPATLDKLTAKAKGASFALPSSFAGAGCTAETGVTVATKKSGKKPGKGTLLLTAKGPKGTKPRSDKDPFQLICLPRTTECPPPTTTTTTTEAPTTTTSVTVVPTTTTTTTTLLSLCNGEPNGTVDGSEECDDGNLIDGDGCSSRCTCCGPAETPASCTAPTHPKTTADAEQCDDGNTVSGDGCDANCTVTGCGNKVVTGTETCDDGNFSDNDDCPADCTVDTCAMPYGAERTATVTFAGVGGASVAGLTVLVDYPEGLVHLGSGPVPPDDLTDAPLDTLVTGNGLEHALRVNVLNTFGDAIPAGTLFTVHFDACAGAAAPTAGQFSCTVLDASNPASETIAATCAVTVP